MNSKGCERRLKASRTWRTWARGAPGGAPMCAHACPYLAWGLLSVRSCVLSWVQLAVCVRARARVYYYVRSITTAMAAVRSSM